MSIILRSYQREALAAVMADLDDGVQRPAVVLPTGSGKTILFTMLSDQWQKARRGPAVILVDRNVLANQTVRRYTDTVPSAKIGMVRAKCNDVGADVIVASVQTLARPDRRAQMPRPGLMIVDECHMAGARTVRDVITWADCPTVGFTATMERSDDKGLGEVWQKISYTKSLLWMIRHRYLCDVRGVNVSVPSLDLAGARSGSGTAADADLGRRLSDSIAADTVAKAYREHGLREDGSVRPGIIFAPLVRNAHEFAQAFRTAGLRCEAIWGEMPDADRRQVLDDFEAGRLDVLSSVNTLSKGFDSPRAEVAVMARPTSSKGLFIQMAGRVLRLFPGKREALILDVVGSSAGNDLCSIADLSPDRGVTVKSGQTLLKALDEADEAEQEQEEAGYSGPIKVEEVDLFGGSRSQWSQTYQGTWFLPAGSRFLAIVPAAGGAPGHDVVWFVAKAKGGGYIARGIHDLSMAMAWAEGDITEDEELYAARDRAWRKRKPSQALLDLARGYRLHQLHPGMAAMRQGAVSDLVNVHLASARMDRALTSRVTAGAR